MERPRWVLLVYRIPRDPSRHRVAVWRKLKDLGASTSKTFRTEYDLDDPVLREIAEIVHDADLMDEKYGRPESEGLDAIVRGMQLSLPDDQALIGHTDVLYEGLYAYLGRVAL